MASVVSKFQLEIGGSRRTGAEGATLEMSVEIHDSLPSDEDTTRRDPGAKSYDINGSAVIDDSYTDLGALYALQGTKVDYLLRPAEAAAGATNPEWAGTSGNSNQAVFEMSNLRIENGQPVRFDFHLACDGAPTFTNT